MQQAQLLVVAHSADAHSGLMGERTDMEGRIDRHVPTVNPDARGRVKLEGDDRLSSREFDNDLGEWAAWCWNQWRRGSVLSDPSKTRKARSDTTKS